MIKNNLFITSCHSRVGKTTFCLALALKLQKDGYQVGYFKPIRDKDIDVDIENARSLLEMSEDLNLISPIVISQWEYDLTKEQIDKKLNEILEAYSLLSKNYDILIIESCRQMSYLSSLNLSTRELAPHLNAKVMILIAGNDETHIDDYILGESFFRDKGINVIGGLISLVPLEIIERVKEISKQRFGKDHRLLGVLPERSDLTAPTVKELASIINAKVLAGSKYMDKIVDDYFIGAMDLENALKLFRKSINKAVIIGGDRPSLAIAAMETDTSTIILTGGIYPPSKVLSVAEDKQVAVLLVQQDTYSLVQYISRNPIKGVISRDQTHRLVEWDKIFSEIDYNYIISQIT
jgi:uncharacterized protein